MKTPRLRMIAGPNGSGKTSLFDNLRRQFLLPVGYWLNADEIELELERSRRLAFGKWGLHVNEKSLWTFLAQHPLAKGKRRAATFKRNALIVNARARRPYLAAILCDFMRRQWLDASESFTFETVMSSRDKVDLMGTARASGYRTYLYYVCTNSPDISRERVAFRVARGGHDVPADKIAARYERSLGLLPDAIARSNRAYLFDNSQQEHRLIAEFDEAKLVVAADDLPHWFVSAVLDKLPPHK
jgi:predicted ABC-type ATPase